MDVSYSKWGEVLCMFWKRPLVCKWEGGSLEAPQKVMSLVERAKAFSPVAAPDANLWSGDCLAGRSHESDSVIAKQSNRKGCWV